MAADEFITIARVVRPQGNRGEVAAEIHTDFPEKFAERRRVFALLSDGVRREMELEECWAHKGRIILKFAGVESIGEAEEFSGAEIQIRSSDRTELEQGAAYVGDLVGCTVLVVTTDTEEAHALREVGSVAEVQFGAGEAPLLVVRAEGVRRREHLIPFAEAYLESLDTKSQRIVMRLPEGMLELDAPLTQEEKERQARGQ